MLSSAYLCSFRGLEVRAVHLDDLTNDPETPRSDLVQTFETQALRETRERLASSGAAEASAYVEQHPHPRLWRSVADAALQKLDFPLADKAFVHCQDYMGVQLVKRLKLLDDAKKQAAEVAAYFNRFDEAERIYCDLDRRDLALQLRSNIGDWAKVVKLAQQGGGDDATLMQAWRRIGDEHAEAGRMDKAAQFYAQAQDNEALVDACYRNGDYEGLTKLCSDLPGGTPLLVDIGRKLGSVGMVGEAADALVKGGEVSEAIELCFAQHQYHSATALAHRQNCYPALQTALKQYATQLIESGQTLCAVELYRKASQHTEAARLLSRLAADVGAARNNPLRAKKLFVAAALEVERMRQSMLSGQAPQGGTQAAAQTLQSLVSQDNATGGDKWLESSWRGAEAYHFLLLAQRQLHSGRMVDAMRTALRLREYESILPAEEVYSLIALAAFHAKHYGQCSRAFMRLQQLAATPAQIAETAKLALSIFTRNPPDDPASPPLECPNCDAAITDCDSSCSDCGAFFAACVVSGKPVRVLSGGGANAMVTYPSLALRIGERAAPRSKVPQLQALVPRGGGAGQTTLRTLSCAAAGFCLLTRLACVKSVQLKGCAPVGEHGSDTRHRGSSLENNVQHANKNTLPRQCIPRLVSLVTLFLV